MFQKSKLCVGAIKVDYIVIMVIFIINGNGKLNK